MHARRFLAAAASLSLLAAPLAAQQPGPAAPQAQRVVAIRAGRLLDGTGAAPRENVVVLVRGNRIAEVGAGVRVPEGAETVDLSGWTVMPGFIDAHTHITGDPSNGYADRELHQFPGHEALVGAKNARLTLLAGFTTIRNVGSGEWADVALRNAVNEGIVPGPRIYAAAHSLGITGGHCDTNGFRPDLREEPGVRQGIANGVDQVREAVRYQVKYGADVIKICATGGVLSAGDAVGVQQYSEEEMRAIVETAALAERKVAAHAHGAEGIRAAVRAGVASIEHGSILDDETLRLMKERGTYLVPTMMAFDYVVQGARSGRLAPWSAAKALEIAPHAGESVRRAIRAGVRIAFGTDAGVFPHGTNADEFRLLVGAGMTPQQAVESATREAARLLGARDLGTVQAGKLADLVAVRGDPLRNVELLRQVGFVMKDGVVYKRDGTPLAEPR
ncbi:MAG TPA: amidohydrolase family protein [Longimicrobiaceae bacterium]